MPREPRSSRPRERAGAQILRECSGKTCRYLRGGRVGTAGAACGAGAARLGTVRPCGGARGARMPGTNRSTAAACRLRAWGQDVRARGAGQAPRTRAAGQAPRASAAGQARPAPGQSDVSSRVWDQVVMECCG